MPKNLNTMQIIIIAIASKFMPKRTRSFILDLIHVQHFLKLSQQLLKL